MISIIKIIILKGQYLKKNCDYQIIAGWNRDYILARNCCSLLMLMTKLMISLKETGWNIENYALFAEEFVGQEFGKNMVAGFF